MTLRFPWALPLLFAAPAWADNIAECEILTLDLIPSEEGEGGMQVAGYSPAFDFIASVYDEEEGHLTHNNDTPIRAVMCRRDDIVPAEKDYALLATGIPFSLSQDFDDTETDSLTVYWDGETFAHVHKGRAMSDETQSLLTRRLADFAGRDHGLPLAKPDATDTAMTEDEE